ncbi:integrase catalytic domain-containing protein [Trichonephila clavipes]|uniref:Integrase catalytic domain-containing protein n=1 Tax=Trichonephila clavipes TaxID=2585209 RepID=A0A8X6RMK4_TRICX|nr:integrase catalytic domain-containing protein [Trichonephila clavipes]
MGTASQIVKACAQYFYSKLSHGLMQVCLPRASLLPGAVLPSACAIVRPLRGLPVSGRLAVAQTFTVFRNLSPSLRMTLTSGGRRDGYKPAYSLAFRKAFPLHHTKATGSYKMHPFKHQFNGGLTSFHGARETDLKGMWGCLRSTDSMAGEAVSLHSLLANRNCKIYRQNFEADDFPSGAVDPFKGGRANSRGVFYSFFVCQKNPPQPGSALATRGQLPPSLSPSFKRVEKPNQSLANILASISQNTNDWDEQLPHTIAWQIYSIILHLRKENSDTPQTKYEYVEKFLPSLEHTFNKVLNNLKDQEASHVEFSTRATKQHHYDYKIGSLCFIKTPNIKSNLSPKLRPKFEGPYRVIERFFNVNYRVQHVEQLRKILNTHVNRMIPFIKRFSYLHLKNLDDLQPDETDVKGIVPGPRYNLRARAGNSAR